MIDSGELDWKVIAINADDPLSANFNSKEDVEKYLPGVISGKFKHLSNYVLIQGLLLSYFRITHNVLLKEYGSGFDGTKLQMASL